jgi:glycosyltransferase involved in cell wall biosynthesis
MPQFQLLIPHLHEPTLGRAVRSGYQDGFDQVLIQEGSLGQQHTRNLLYARATAPYVAYLDADDLRLPGALLAQFTTLKAHDADVVFSPNHWGLTYPDLLRSLIHSRVNASCLWRTTALERLALQYGGPWDTTWELCSDAVILLQALRLNLKIAYSPVPCIRAAPGGQLTKDKRRWAESKLRLLGEIEANCNFSYYPAIAQEKRLCHSMLTMSNALGPL